MFDDEDPLLAAEPVSRREALAGLGILGGLMTALAGVVAYRVVDEGRQRQNGSSGRGTGWAASSVAPASIHDQAATPAAYVTPATPAAYVTPATPAADVAPATAPPGPTRSSSPRFVAPGGSSSAAARGESAATPVE